MTARRRILTATALATIGAASLAPGMATADTTPPTTTYLSDNILLGDYAQDFGPGSSPDDYGFTSNTDASFGAWWLDVHGVRFDGGRTGKVLSAAGKVVKLGLPYTWTTSAKSEGGTTSTTPTPGWFAVWAKGAKVHGVDPSTYVAQTVTVASKTDGAVGFVYGVNSNGTMLIAHPDATQTSGFSTTTVLSKETGMTFVHFVPSHNTNSFSVTLKNTSKTVSIPLSITINGTAAGNVTLAPSASQSFSEGAYNYGTLLGNTIVISRAGKKVTTITTVGGGTKTVTFTK